MSTRRTTTTSDRAEAAMPTGESNALAHGQEQDGGGFDPTARVSVNKAYKMFVGGAFVRSESGRFFQVTGAPLEGSADPEVVNVPRGSRKDARDAVLAARNAADGWAARTAYNRGDGVAPRGAVRGARSRRRGGRAGRARGGDRDRSRRLLRGLLRQVPGARRVAQPGDGAALRLQSARADGGRRGGRARATGARGARLDGVAGRRRWQHEDPRTAVVWCECLATSDLPGGVVNVLTGQASEIAPHLAKHREVAAMDAWSGDADLRAAVEREGSGNVKRVKTHDGGEALRLLSDAGQGLGFIERHLETKTVWHPVGV
jgi:hypothetical protein